MAKCGAIFSCGLWGFLFSCISFLGFDNKSLPANIMCNSLLSINSELQSLHDCVNVSASILFNKCIWSLVMDTVITRWYRRVIRASWGTITARKYRSYSFPDIFVICTIEITLPPVACRVWWHLIWFNFHYHVAHTTV